MNKEEIIKENEYKCASCDGVFEKSWSDEEAKEEAEGYFGKPVEKWKDDPVLVCDDCYNKMHPKDNPEAVKRAKEQI